MRCTFTVYVDSPDGGRMPVRVTVAAGDTQPETYAKARAPLTGASQNPLTSRAGL